jgi:hypothetical protein
MVEDVTVCMICQFCATEHTYDSKWEQCGLGRYWHSRCIICWNKTSVLSFIYFVPWVVQWAEFVGECGTLQCLYTAIERKPLCCVTTVPHLPALPRMHWASCSRRCWTVPHTFHPFHFMPSLCLAPSRKLPKGYRFGLHKGFKWFQQQLTEFFAEGRLWLVYHWNTHPTAHVVSAPSLRRITKCISFKQASYRRSNFGVCAGWLYCYCSVNSSVILNPQ